ncbi:MAG: rod shape-determining protein [Gallintestinimicrobium sp.]
MYEKAPANIQISHPLSNGVIADINNMERLIHLFISDMSKEISVRQISISQSRPISRKWRSARFMI